MDLAGAHWLANSRDHLSSPERFKLSVTSRGIKKQHTKLAVSAQSSLNLSRVLDLIWYVLQC